MFPSPSRGADIKRARIYAKVSKAENRALAAKADLKQTPPIQMFTSSKVAGNHSRAAMSGGRCAIPKGIWQLSPAREKYLPFRKRPLCGRLSVGKGVSALRWLVVAPMCPACMRGFAWPLALMPFARFRSLPIARTRSAGVGRVLLLRRFQPACCVSSVCPLQLL